MMEIQIIQGALGGFLASLGFGVLFNIHGRSLFFAGIDGAIGGVVYNMMIVMGAGEIFANFAGAIAFSFAAEIMARLLKTTVTTFTAPALIPLVPGGTVYKMMVQLIQGHLDTGLQLGLQTLEVGGVLALGIMLVSTLSRLFFWIRTHLMKAKTKIEGLKS
jgi:uncharacterized membrane protein YjjB (DUF3815 family)